MKIISNYILSVGLLLLSASCSTTSENESGPSPKVYSPRTEKEFAAIENSDLFYDSSKPRNSRSSMPHANIVTRESIKTTPPAKISNPEMAPVGRLSAKNQERLQEINQQLAFFCMKQRKNPRFANEEQCLNLTKKVLNSCEKKHQIINSVMLNCIKEQLRKNR